MIVIKKLAIIILFLVLLLIPATFWFNAQNTDEGYVYTTVDTELWIIELNEEDVKGKNSEELLQLLEIKASESQGGFYNIPLINDVVNSDYKSGNKVKIYWNGIVHQTLPPRIDGTNLIIKTEE